MVHFKFIEDINSYQPIQSFIAEVDSNVRTKGELLNELYNKLQLPDYFSFNWDALSDCLRDFHWMQNKGIVLIHTVIPHIEENDLKIYLEILNDAVQDWQTDENHYLEVIFPKSSEDALKALVSI
ncbi:barstar family protein [Parapedobacter tibetensis]|uniref:barstar family protein n=1 Tax=Parapedobacter tibetensis TaxID=2972951 RepID=UPI00214DA0CB|nr:barstar family protein [Parapedobacter tibetensis]